MNQDNLHSSGQRTQDLSHLDLVAADRAQDRKGGLVGEPANERQIGASPDERVIVQLDTRESRPGCLSEEEKSSRGTQGERKAEDLHV